MEACELQFVMTTSGKVPKAPPFLSGQSRRYSGDGRGRAPDEGWTPGPCIAETARSAGTDADVAASAEAESGVGGALFY